MLLLLLLAPVLVVWAAMGVAVRSGRSRLADGGDDDGSIVVVVELEARELVATPVFAQLVVVRCWCWRRCGAWLWSCGPPQW